MAAAAGRACCRWSRDFDDPAESSPCCGGSSSRSGRPLSFSLLQSLSLHTDAHDEVLSVPTEAAARIAISTQNILKEEAHLTEVIDPLGGS